MKGVKLYQNDKCSNRKLQIHTVSLMSDLNDLILYCDAGFLLDKKVGGYGIHGYSYMNEVPKRGTGNPKAKPTKLGYIDSADKEDLITIVKYVDLCGPLSNVTSSNEAELHALRHALELIKEDGTIGDVLLYSDSKYTVQGITKWVNNWAKSNWNTSNGQPVKNTTLWKEVKELWDEVGKERSLSIEWIKGHNGHIGNVTADELATRGLVLSLNGTTEVVHKESEMAGYWNTANVSIPRLLEAPRFYILTFGEAGKLVHEEYATYFLGVHGGKDKDDDMLCKPYACNYMAVVRTKTKDPIIEAVKEEVVKLENSRNRPIGTIVIGNGQNLLSRRTYRDVTEHGLKFMRRSTSPITISTASGNELASELVPLGRGYKLLDICSSLQDRLSDLVDGKGYFTFTDLKDELFEEVVVKKEPTLRIKASLTSSVKFIRLEGKFCVGTDEKPSDVFTQRTSLILGSDLPTRNQLSALCQEIEKIQLVSWRDSSTSCRYGTYLTFKNGDSAFWSRYDANLLIMKNGK